MGDANLREGNKSDHWGIALRTDQLTFKYFFDDICCLKPCFEHDENTRKKDGGVGSVSANSDTARREPTS
jgi:hypothetical protein